MTTFAKTVRLDGPTPTLCGRLASITLALLAAFAVAILAVTPVHAQGVESFDPDEAFQNSSASSASAASSGAIDADLVSPSAAQTAPDQPVSAPRRVPATPSTAPDVETGQAPGFDNEFSDLGAQTSGNDAVNWADPDSGASVGVDAGDQAVQTAAAGGSTYAEDDLIGAAEGVFGKGAEGLAKLIQDLLKKEGEPNAYIVGREAGGAFVVGARYGSGTLNHKVEGQRKVYWTGPSIGFDAGANAANTFVLVYNLFDSEDLYKRYPAGEGQAYLVG
ncbi:MAG: EipA family protein, partial [Erythrobacter sp.]